MLAISTNPFNTRWSLTISLILFITTVLTRIPFASTILSHWDSVQFALATERYDITVHQPHPPGYFLYVMLGKLLNYFTGDPNTSFVLISIIASGLTVSTIFILANKMYDGITALGSSVLAISSPLFWFYSEVALTYIVEAFFSVSFAYLCWRVLNGEHWLIFLSALVLALAAGVRQSTLVFLLPLWLFSIRKSPYTYILISFTLLAAGILLWFLPMLSMTGGYAKYKAALNELWAFTVEPYTLINVGVIALFYYFKKFLHFITYGLGLCSAFLIFYIFRIRLTDIRKELLSKNAIFFVLWITPYIFSLLIFFMNTANPGYGLIFMPAVLIVSVKILKSITERIYSSSKIIIVLIFLTIIFNLYVFFFSSSPISINMLKKNHSNITSFIRILRANLSPSDTVILSPDYIFFGARHFMYYLPEYRVYVMDERTDMRGKGRKVFWGKNRNTSVSDYAYIPKGTKYFVSPFDNETSLAYMKKSGEKIKILSDGKKDIAFYANIDLAPKAYKGVTFDIKAVDNK